jgi:hypothetical protein
MGKFNIKDEEDFATVKKSAEVFYKTIGSVNCPYFNGIVSFNAKGWRHLTFKNDRQARLQIDQYARLKLLHLAPEIIKKSHTIQGVWQTRIFEQLKTNATNNQWSKILKDVCFYEFIAVLGNVRVKVIIKQVQNGEKYFWSVIPFWGVDKMTSKRILYGGSPDLD